MFYPSDNAINYNQEGRYLSSSMVYLELRD